MRNIAVQAPYYKDFTQTVLLYRYSSTVHRQNPPWLPLLPERQNPGAPPHQGSFPQHAPFRPAALPPLGIYAGESHHGPTQIGHSSHTASTGDQRIGCMLRNPTLITLPFYSLYSRGISRPEGNVIYLRVSKGYLHNGVQYNPLRRLADVCDKGTRGVQHGEEHCHTEKRVGYQHP